MIRKHPGRRQADPRGGAPPAPLLSVRDGFLVLVKPDETSAGPLTATGAWGLCDPRPLSHLPVFRALVVNFGLDCWHFCIVSAQGVMTS